jgi:hypothetical protein
MRNSMRAMLICILTVCHGLIICLVAGASNSQDKYSTYSNSRFSYSISYPTALLIPQGEADNGDGQKFLSRDGRAEMIVYGSNNALEQSLRDLYNEQLRRAEGDDRSKKTVTYKVLRDNWFVVSGYEGYRVFYQKTIFRGGVFKTFRIEYDKSLADIFDKVTKRVAASFRG